MGLPIQNEPHLSAEMFMVWYDQQPDGMRYELLDGQIYEMQSERLTHSRVKARIDRAFAQQIADRRLPCEAFQDGVAIMVDNESVFEPDASVRCGAPLAGDVTRIMDPLIVVEVASPSTQRVDALVKYSRYFRNPSIIHYLIVIPSKPTAIHHRRLADGQIVGRSYETGIIRFDPPGIELDIGEVLADLA